MPVRPQFRLLPSRAGRLADLFCYNQAQFRGCCQWQEGVAKSAPQCPGRRPPLSRAMCMGFELIVKVHTLGCQLSLGYIPPRHLRGTPHRPENLWLFFPFESMLSKSWFLFLSLITGFSRSCQPKCFYRGQYRNMQSFGFCPLTLILIK